MHCRGLRGGVESDEERRRIGIARRQHGIAKLLVHVPGGGSRIDALHILTAATPEFDHPAGALHPITCRRSCGPRGLPPCFRRTWTEHKREETLLGMKAGSIEHSQ